ncbi:MAG: hypothetical protein R3F29_07150 [Planctomycetota bacterium]
MLPVIAQEKQQDPATLALAEFYRSPAWAEFLDQVGGEWQVRWCPATGTPRSILGSGVALTDWRASTLEEARRQADLLLQQRARLLGLGSSEFREIIGQRMGRSWAFVYDQYFRGLQVIGGRADVRVHQVGRVPMFGSQAWQIPDSFDTTPSIDDHTALAIAWAESRQVPTGVSQPARPAAPRLVIWGDVDSPTPTSVSLAWEVSISNVAADGSGMIGRYYIDAASGAVLRYQNDKHECGNPDCNYVAAGAVNAAPDESALPVLTTVTVMGWTRTGDDGFDPLVNVPLPGLELNVPGVGTVVTDQNGQFTINIASAVSISVGALDGRHHQPIAGGNAPSGSFNVTPGVNSTIQLLTSGATFNQAAHTTTSWWVDRTNEFCRSILGNSSELNTASNVVPTVNISSTCNAYYTGNTINFYQAGGGCNNTAFSTVVAHEWGHGLDDRYGGISQTNGLSEGWGDILGLYLVDSPILGSGFQTAGVGIRDGNNTRQYPGGSGVHAQGESWMGFAWNFRDRLASTLGNRPAAIAISNDIVIGTIVADATNQADAVVEVFIADDDNGDLSDGTPHSADLIWACNQHSLPYPTGGGGGGPANDDCGAAIAVVNGVNGPYSNVGAATSSPSWPCAAGGNDIWFSYNAPIAGTLTVTTCGNASYDTCIEILSGSCGSLTSVVCNDDACGLQSTVSTPVSPGLYYIRVGGYSGATGSFSIDVNGPTGTPASVELYGTGCYNQSTAFYELMPNTAFDLSGTMMTLVRTGNHYVAIPFGAFVAPSGAATTLTMTDDAVASVGLSGTFSFPGGSTSSLEVCSNGFVSASSGNGTGYTPSISGWLNSAAPRWGTWHDFNPAAAGTVTFEQIGAVAYVTWNGVRSYGTSDNNTFQLQFDLGTGNVTYAWQSMVATGNAWLVGFTSVAPNLDAGNVDISAALPGGFQTSDTNSAPLAIDATLPVLGSNCTLTTSQFPASSVLGVQLISTTRIDPGLDLSIIGMQGCYLYANLDSLDVLWPVGGSATHVLSIPNNPVLMGAVVVGQSAAFVNGVNSAGLISSNGVALTIGV